MPKPAGKSPSLKQLGKDKKYQNRDPAMDQDIHKVKTPGPKAKKVIINHIHNMNQRSVIVRSTTAELPETLKKYFRYKLYVSNPMVLQYLVLIVIYKIAGKGVEIYGKGHKRYDKNWHEFS